jgi:hypothetical protein
MRKTSVPLTSDELLYIAESVRLAEEATMAFVSSETGALDLRFDDVIVPIRRADSDDEIVGEVRAYDEWFGFYPFAVTDDRSER